MVLEQFIIDADIIWDQVGKTFFENPEAKPGRIMRVQVVNAGIVEDLTGYTLNLGWTSVRDPSKFGLDAFDDVDITKGIFEIEYTSGMLTNIGPLNASLQLVPPGEGRPIESNNFKLTVKNSAINPEAIQGETSFSTLENALVEVNGWNARIDVVEQEFKDRADVLDEVYPQRLTAAELQLKYAATKAELSEVASPLVASLASQMTDTTRVYVYTGEESGYIKGNWYYHNGTVWAMGGVYQSTGIPDRGIIEQKLAFEPLKGNKSKNIFNKATVLSGYYMPYNTGVLTALVNYSLGDFESITPSTEYSRVIATHTCFFDVNKVYISGTLSKTFTTPSNAYYIRITVPNSSLSTEQLELGSANTSYEKYGISPTNIRENSILSPMKSVLGESGFILLSNRLPANVDFTGKNVTLPEQPKFLYYRNKQITLSTSAIVIPSKDGGLLSGTLIYDLDISAFRIETNTLLSENCIVLGFLNNGQAKLNCLYTIAGKEPLGTTIQSSQTSIASSSGFLISRDLIKINTINMTFGLNKNQYNSVFFKKSFKNLDLSAYTADSDGYVYIPLSADSYLYVDGLTGIISSGALTSLSEESVLLGFIGTSSVNAKKGTFLLTSNYTVDGKANIPTNSITPDMMAFSPTIDSKWKGKKIVTFGDSITWYDGVPFTNTHIEYGQTAKGYQSYMREKLGCAVDNKGYSGAHIKLISSNRIKGYATYADVDAVTITSGANDHRIGFAPGSVQPIGSVFDLDTYAGAFQDAIEYLLAQKPSLKIYLITPIKGWFTAETTTRYNGENIISETYINIMKEIAELYSLPILDWYHTSGINDLNYYVNGEPYYIGDNPAVWTAYQLHPTQIGFGRMGDMLIPFLNNN